jgi:vitamin B12 transporter
MQARFAMHSQFGNKLVYNLNPSYSNSAFKDISLLQYRFFITLVYTNRILNWRFNFSTTKKMQTELGFETTCLVKKVTLTAIAFLEKKLMLLV